MNVTAYCRVSSKAQDFATQRAAIEKTAAARGDSITDWRQEKRSGRTLARPALDQLRADARAGRVSKLYVYRLDRLSRSGIRDTFEVVEELRAHHVELVSVSDGFALDGPAAEVVLAVMSWAAKMERLAINERISSARERVEAEGKSWGRPARLTPQERANVVELGRQGLSVRDIAVKLKVSRSVVHRALSQNPAAAKAA